MNHSLERKRVATQALKGLDLPTGLRAKALAVAASDGQAGNSLRDLIALNDDDDLKPALVSFLEVQAEGKPSSNHAQLSVDS